MSREVTLDDVQRAAAAVQTVKSQLADTTLQINTLARRARLARMKCRYFSAARATRLFFETQHEWKPVVVITAPFLCGAAFLVLAHTVGGSTVVYLSAGVLGAFVGALLVGNLMFIPSRDVIDEAHIKISATVEHLTLKLSELLSMKSTLQQDLRRTQRQFADYEAEYKHLQQVKSQEYISQKLSERNWRAMRSVEFENFLQEVFEALGYNVEETPTSGDQGVDLLVVKHGWRIAVQVKGYLHSVSNSAVQEAFAGMAHYGCNACAVATNSLFTPSARELAASTGCLLIDEENIVDVIMGRKDLLQLTRMPLTPERDS